MTLLIISIPYNTGLKFALVVVNYIVILFFGEIMKQFFKAALVVLPMTFAMTGCVVVAGGDGEHKSWTSSDSEWKKVQKDNKAKIAKLNIGDSYQMVRDEMGIPAFNEAFEDQGKQVNVLFYRTRHRHSDGDTTKDECTPLIFVDGVLTSWGQKAYEKL